MVLRSRRGRVMDGCKQLLTGLVTGRCVLATTSSDAVHPATSVHRWQMEGSVHSACPARAVVTHFDWLVQFG